MVVNADDGRRRLANRGSEHLPGMGQRSCRGAGRDLDPLAKPVAPVEAERPELLDVQPRSDGRHVLCDEIGAVQDRRLMGRQADRPSRDLHGGDELQGLDPADSPQAPEVGLVPAEETRK